MTQMSLDELPPVARNSDPATSQMAVPSAQSRRTQMAALLAAIAAEPLTAEEAGARCGLDTYQAHRRTADLKNTEQIVDSGLRRRGESGRLAIVWRTPGPCSCIGDDSGEAPIVNPDCDRHG